MKSFRVLTAAVTLGLATFVSRAQAGFCCRTTQAIKLISDPAAPVRLSGRAEIDQCYGMSFLRVVVSGNLPDGAVVMPVLPAAEPILGEWITITRRHGEGVTGPSPVFGSLTGRTVVIMDDTFTPLASGTF